MDLVSAIISACSGPAASGGKVGVHTHHCTARHKHWLQANLRAHLSGTPPQLLALPAALLRSQGGRQPRPPDHHRHDIAPQMSDYTYADVTVHIREGALGDGLGVKVWTVAHLVSRWAWV